MKFYIDPLYEPQPLKLIGKRALISIDMLPFMHMLTPLPLTLATLRNPPGLMYPKKIFNVIKKALLQRTFKKRFIKNEQKVKFLIRGYELLKKQKLSEQNPTHKPIKTMIPKSFNLNSIKEWFDLITQPSLTSKNMNFIESIPMILKRRRQSENCWCMRMRKVINEILQLEQKKEYEKCEMKYRKQFLKISIPWTEEVYNKIEVFGKGLWERYILDDLCDLKSRKFGEKKRKKIRKAKNSNKKVERETREKVERKSSNDMKLFIEEYLSKSEVSHDKQ